MAELVCGGVKTSESEFVNGLNAACGPYAAATAARWADQSSATPTGYALFQRMRALGLGGSNGLSDLDELATTLQKFDAKGYTVVRPNRGELLLQFMNRMAGIAAVVWETGNGQALKDYLTGMGEDASNLQRHILCSWGTNTGGASELSSKTLPNGFWMSDGDSDTQNTQNGARYHWPINQRLVYYPTTVVMQANPINALAVMPRVAIPGGNTMSGVPTGWKDNGTTLLAPNGVPVTHGFRDYVLAHAWDANNFPLAAEAVVASVEPGNAAIGAGSRQDFRLTSLGWTQARNVYVIYVGQDIRALEQQLAAALAHVTTLEQQLAAVPAPAPPTPPDPIAAQALDVLTRMKALFGEL